MRLVNDGNEEGDQRETLANHRPVHQDAVRPHIAQQAVVRVPRVDVELEEDLRSHRHQPDQSLRGHGAKRLLGGLRGVHSDQPHPAERGAVQGVTVHDPRHRTGLRLPDWGGGAFGGRRWRLAAQGAFPREQNGKGEDEQRKSPGNDLPPQSESVRGPASVRSVRHKVKARRPAPMEVPMSATLKVQNLVLPIPISMKSTTPWGERRRSQAFPRAPPMTSARATARRTESGRDLAYHRKRTTATTTPTTPRISFPWDPAGRPSAAPRLKVRVRRRRFPTTSWGGPRGERDSTAAHLLAKSARRTVIRVGQKTRPFLDNRLDLLRSLARLRGTPPAGGWGAALETVRTAVPRSPESHRFRESS